MSVWRVYRQGIRISHLARRQDAKNRSVHHLPASTMERPAVTPEDIASLEGFARHVCGIEPYDWQRDVFAAIEPKGSRTALRTCNEAGKTSTVVSCFLAWNALTNPESLGVVTSGVARQVQEQCWPSLERMTPRLRNLGWEVVRGEARMAFTKSRILGFTASEGGRFEGFHARGPHLALAMVIDEAKTVRDFIFEAAERCRPDRYLITSSPGGRSGNFYRAFTAGRGAWRCMPPVTVDDCPHIPREHIELQIRQWGRDHPLVKSMLFAEWMDGEDGWHYLVLPDWLEAMRANQPTHIQRDKKAAGVDFAAGGDENVVAIRLGNKVLPLISWRDTNTMAAVGRMVAEFRRFELQPTDIYADATGLGHVMCDRLTELGWPVNRVQFGGAPNDKARFDNRGTEIWNMGARYIERREIILPEDGVMEAQLCARRQTTTSRGVLILESKDAMRERGEPSPDKADAVMLSINGGGIAMEERWQHSQQAWDAFEQIVENLQSAPIPGVHTG